ncbi:MAG: phosphate transport system regulatory protein PhoU, partial [Acidimicrobiia bacterium]|nr:phosphate transport system regulatory protein PhoU [Acidimicrobiia bacterium]
MTELRAHFHDELEQLEHDLVLMGEQAAAMVRDSVAALV